MDIYPVISGRPVRDSRYVSICYCNIYRRISGGLRLLGVIWSDSALNCLYMVIDRSDKIRDHSLPDHRGDRTEQSRWQAEKPFACGLHFRRRYYDRRIDLECVSESWRHVVYAGSGGTGSRLFSSGAGAGIAGDPE
mgnify:CR=1 FL=1